MGFFGTLFGGRSAKDEVVAAQRAATAKVIDPVLAKARAGGEPTDHELEQCRASFAALYEALSARHGTDDNTRFSKEHQADFYVEALKLSALRHPEHDAWPVMAGVRKQAWSALQKRTSSGDPWVALCAIQPALLQGQVKDALHCYSKIEGDPFLSQLAIAWANDAVMAFSAYNHAPSAQEFLSAIRGAAPWSAPELVMAEGRRWPLLAAIYPFLSRDPRGRLADPRPAAAVRVQLKRDWEVTDREEALACIGWLRDVGHRSELASELESSGPAEDERGHYVAQNRAALERHGILAWDLCRLISVARAAHTLRLLDERETWDAVLDAGNRLREEYASWSELGDDFLLGCGFWNPDSVQNGAPYVSMVRWLQKDPRSPWQRVPFGAR
jgi:Protein of unknown function (DUF1266)